MNTFFGNLVAACLAFACVLWLQWNDVEAKIRGMADAYGAPAQVERTPVTPAEAAPAASAAPAPTP